MSDPDPLRPGRTVELPGRTVDLPGGTVDLELPEHAVERPELLARMKQQGVSFGVKLASIHFALCRNYAMSDPATFLRPILSVRQSSSLVLTAWLYIAFIRISVSVCLSVCLSVRPSVRPSVGRSIDLSACRPA